MKATGVSPDFMLGELKLKLSRPTNENEDESMSSGKGASEEAQTSMASNNVCYILFV